MKIDFCNARKAGKNLYSVAYFKNGAWRIYDRDLSEYKIKSVNKAKNLLKEVSGEKNVSIRNVKIVELTHLVAREITSFEK